MLTFYLIIVIVLFFLAISDLIVGVSNDAVNFLNSAVGSKAAHFKIVLAVAALGILVGSMFSGGMMEVARNGIFHPSHFYFSEIILLFLAVMVTDIILLDTFNSFGMPTSTTVSIVFELLGAATAFTIIKVYTDPNALEVSEYINSAKALAIIAGILFSVVVAFVVGVVFQYLTRLLFSFNYAKSFKYFGSIWGGLAIMGLTYFMLIKGAKGASFITPEMEAMITEHAWLIMGGTFLFWTVILTFVSFVTKFDILKFIVLVGTFALAMAFAGNDLVNFIGVPLAGYNAYELYMVSGTAADQFLMTGLAGKVPTPTILLVLAGIIMVVTLWTSAKARTVIKTSLDLGRQRGGSERFSSYAASRSIVRHFSRVAIYVNELLPEKMTTAVYQRFDQAPFLEKQKHLGKEAPAFDLLRAATTLVVASSLIAFGTAYKLPLSTTYVTFMVFMGTSLADGAWGRESAVYRVSGVLSVVGGWFFTAFSAFTGAFILAGVFYLGGNYAILPVILLAIYVVYRTHRFHGSRMDEEAELEKSIIEGPVTKAALLDVCARGLDDILRNFISLIDETLDALEDENLAKLTKINLKFQKLNRRTRRVKDSVNEILDRVGDEDIEVAQFYVLAADYTNEMALHVGNIVGSSLSHVDNSHKPLLPVQIEELKFINKELKVRIIATVDVFKSFDKHKPEMALIALRPFGRELRTIRKNQIKRIKNHEIGTRNSQLFLNILSEFRNLALFTIRLLRVYDDLILDADEDIGTEEMELAEELVENAEETDEGIDNGSA